MPTDADPESKREAEASAQAAFEEPAVDAEDVADGIGKSGTSRRAVHRKGAFAGPAGGGSIPSKRSGNTIYMSGEALERPIEMPRKIITRSLILVLIAAAVGAVFLGIYFDGMVNGPAREQARIDEYAAKQTDLGLPDMAALIPLDDAAILASLEEGGATLFERSQAGSGKPFEVIKLPQDVTLADAAALYVKGISSLSASDAVLLLNGSWDLTVNRENGMNMGIHYADFSSGSLERAVSNAAHSQGFDTEGDVDSGVDSSGNTFISGAIDIGEDAYSWKVSAVPLSDIYRQRGLPEDAVYVGIRLYR